MPEIIYNTYLGQCIPFCIAMNESNEYKFNNIIKEIIKKSLFTERQIEIIRGYKEHSKTEFGISRGAYYRQLGQSKTKLERLYYTMSLLLGLGILDMRDVNVMSKLSKQINEIKNHDVFPEREQDVITLLDQVINQACKS